MALGRHVQLGFSPNIGKYFSLIDDQGKLRIWDTETNELKQEYTPNLHLSGPCTALTWVIVGSAQTSDKKSPKKPRKSLTTNDEALYIALGSSTGGVTLYSYAQGKIERTLKGNGHKGKVTAIVTDNVGNLYTTGTDCELIVWSLAKEERLTSWKIGNEVPASVAFMPLAQAVVIGARQIKVYSLETQELLQTFTGHTSDVNLMSQFVVNEKVEYAITTSQMERIICLWKIGKKGRNKSPVCTLLMEDIAHCLSCQVDEEGNLKVASVTRSGVIHIFLIPVDSIKAEKPVKPKVTITIASDSASVIEPIAGVAASWQHSKRLQNILIGYGDKHFLIFEQLTPQYGDKMQVLVRTDPKKQLTKTATQDRPNKQKDGGGPALKTLVPTINSANVEYKSALTVSKKKLKPVEMPMESRLQNLNLNAPAGTVTPQAQSKVQLLVQALHSKDTTLLRSVLSTNDWKTIQLTLQKLPVQYVGPLVNELTLLMQLKSMHVEYALKWLKTLTQTHASQLLALGADDLLEKFGPCIGIIEHRANCLMEMSKFSGRLQLLLSQIKRNVEVESEDLNSENVLVYEDNDSSNSDLEDSIDKSSSIDEFDEDDEDELENMEQDDEDDDDGDDVSDDVDVKMET